MNLASGTSVNPASSPQPMRMRHYGNWNTMFMGEAFLGGYAAVRSSRQRQALRTELVHGVGGASRRTQGRVRSRDHAEPRSGDGHGSPLSAPVPNGETAYGVPSIDAQHPHNFIMALGFHYTRKLGDGALLDVYAAPVGDPALGPVAFPHRASALELPQATISHHLQDSTHIADDVITIGLARKKFKLEASGFHGTEPGENRWIVEAGTINSWSGRLWFSPRPDWAAQFSAGRIAHPERLEPGDQVRGYRLDRVHAPGGGRKLVLQCDLGSYARHRNSAELELIPRGNRAADSSRELPHWPL